MTSTAITFERVALRAEVRRSAGSACRVVAAADQIVTLYQALALSAESNVKEFVTGPYGKPRTLPTGEPHPLESVYFSPHLSERGARHLTVYDSTFLEEDDGLEDMITGHADGEEIRLIQEKLPMKLLIVDDDTVLLPLGPYGFPGLRIRDEGLVRLFARLFELKWAQAKPWAPPGTSIPEKENSQRRQVLDALAAGLKDEAIARQQDISVRTVRRHIAALMEELGVTTRFAAGVAAARRGWLSPAA